MTKTQLMDKIVEMSAQKEPAADALLRAVAVVVAGPDATRIKHMFYCTNSPSGGGFQLSLDMHDD